MTSTNATSAVTLNAIQALRALDPTVYDPDTGLMTLQVADDGAAVTFSAAGVDLGSGVGVATTDRTVDGSVNVVVGGHRLATINHTGVTAAGPSAGTITIDVGSLLFGQVTPAYYQGDDRQLAVRADENTEITYGITALTPERANPAQLLQLNRAHWSIENRSHYVRDVTFDEDRSQVRTRNGPRVMATLRNFAISLLRLLGVTRIPSQLRAYARKPHLALRLLGV